MEAADGVVAEVGVVGEGGGDPGVRELEEGGAAGAEEDGRLAIDVPGDGLGAKEAELGAAGEAGEGTEEILAFDGGDDMGAGGFHMGSDVGGSPLVS